MLHDSESLRQAFHYFFPNELPLLKSLPGLVAHSPCIVVNIGAGAGTSGLAFLESREDLILHTIDIQDEGSPFGCLSAERKVGTDAGYTLGGRWFQHHGDSKQVAQMWAKPVDIVFVDGDHTLEGCTGDILGWLPHIRSGGLIAIHDYYKSHIPTGPDGFHADGPHPLPFPEIDLAVDELLRGNHDIIDYVDSLIVFKIER